MNTNFIEIDPKSTYIKMISDESNLRDNCYAIIMIDQISAVDIISARFRYSIGPYHLRIIMKNGKSILSRSTEHNMASKAQSIITTHLAINHKNKTTTKGK